MTDSPPRVEQEIRAVTFTVRAEIRPDESLHEFLDRWHRAFMQARGVGPIDIAVTEPYPTPFVVPIPSVPKEKE